MKETTRLEQIQEHLVQVEALCGHNRVLCLAVCLLLIGHGAGATEGLQFDDLANALLAALGTGGVELAHDQLGVRLGDRRLSRIGRQMRDEINRWVYDKTLAQHLEEFLASIP